MIDPELAQLYTKLDDVKDDVHLCLCDPECYVFDDHSFVEGDERLLHRGSAGDGSVEGVHSEGVAVDGVDTLLAAPSSSAAASSSSSVSSSSANNGGPITSNTNLRGTIQPKFREGKVYGRDNEVSLITDAFCRVSAGENEAFFIGGYSG